MFLFFLQSNFLCIIFFDTLMDIKAFVTFLCNKANILILIKLFVHLLRIFTGSRNGHVDIRCLVQ